ncbi:DcaP family trimeric outer membrane transporter [Glaciecola sp. SC05]|uniref:DcaP family trimeric outer membrane transporter n=1 Tax=Glaciecola sp. SC05 TaxID=1987355 RepID=UPI00352924E5
MNNTFRKTIAALAVISGLGATSAQAVEIFSSTVDDKTTKVAIGGYVKVDVRHVNGDIGYQDYWVANLPGGQAIETNKTGFNIRESRLNFKITHGDVSGFFELDMYGGGGNEVISNSSNPRLRLFYIQYKNWMVGQNWSTFMPLHALPEALDFGGPHVGEVFVRDVQIRYTYGNWQFAIENPETNGDGDSGTPASAVGLSGAEADPDESVPDFVVRYNASGDWGVASAGVLVRKVDQGGLDEMAIAGNIAAKIKLSGKDDFRFQVSVGDPGRYVAAGMTPDIVTNPDNDEVEVESTIAYAVSYRHFWTDTMRSTVFYGAAQTDILDRDRSHWGVNILENINEDLEVGLEFGNYAIDDAALDAIDSNYLQFSAKMTF